MKILLLNWRDIKHPLAGGAEISTHEHAKKWVKAGYEVIQFSSSFANAKKIEIIDGIKIIRRGSHYTVHIHAFLYYLLCLRKENIDLIVEEFHFLPYFTPLYTKKKKIGFIHEVAGETWFKNTIFPLNILGYIIEPFFFKLYKDVPFITVSRSTKRDLIKLGIKDENIHIIHNGVNSINVKNNKEIYPTIIYLGKLAKDKGIEDAVHAFYEVQQKFEKANLWVVGKEEQNGFENKIKVIIKNLKMTEKVKFFGYVSEMKKFELLKRAHILIHPSMKEGWGLTVIEAASCATPTVSYNVSGLCDSVLNNKTGLLATKNNPSELASKVLRLFNDQTLYEKLSRNAIIWSKNFNWKNSTEESMKVIQDLK